MEAKLAKNILCHSFSFDRRLLVYSNSSENIHVLHTPSEDPKTWEELTILKSHETTISSLSFHPFEYKFVSCSQDRNAYVWSLSNLQKDESKFPLLNLNGDKNKDNTKQKKEWKSWKPTLVLCKLNRAAISVSWSPRGDRFSIASGSKVVSVCYYDGRNDWWVANLIRKHRSSVLRAVWHPSGLVLATTCTDYRCRVFSAFIKKIDEVPSKEEINNNNNKHRTKKEDLERLKKIFEDKKVEEFGELLAMFDTGKKFWTEGVAFNIGGDNLVFTTHEPSLYVCDLKGQMKEFPFSKSSSSIYKYNPDKKLIDKDMKKIRLTFTDLDFVNDQRFIAVGYEGKPFLYEIEKETLNCKEIKSLLPLKKIPKEKESDFERKKSKLHAELVLGLSKDEADMLKESENRHSSIITGIEVNIPMGIFSTCGLDGRIISWKFDEYKIIV